MSSIPNVIADFSTILALKVAVGATIATLVSATDSDGVALPTGTYGFTIDRKNSSKEYITCTLTGTSLTNISTIAVGTGVATSGFAKAHRRSAEVVLTDFVAIKRIQDVLESGYASATTPTTDYQLATKKYVDDIALGGTTTVDRVTVVATCGENVTAGQLLYLKTSDSKWWKTDADTVATVDNVVLGIAQGSGTANGLITGGVLIKGVDGNLTGLTANSIYYAGNTAGAVSATTGTNCRIVGVATAADKLYFDPEFNKVYKDYAVDAAGSDTYVITLQSAFGALYEGMKVTFKAGTANTGACTLNINGLGAKTIKKNVTDDLVTGDILQNQIVTVVYDGTNMQIISKTPSPITPTIQTFTVDGTYTKPAGLKYAIVEAQGGGGAGAASGSGGGGGGGGAYSKKIIPAASIGTTEAVTVATAGLGSGNTSFGALLVAPNGVNASTTTGGAAGTASGGDINISGQTGQNAASAGRSGGKGGDSCLGGGGGGGGTSDDAATANNGANGAGYGGGGGGAAASTDGNPPGTGGDGTVGIVIVTEFY